MATKPQNQRHMFPLLSDSDVRFLESRVEGFYDVVDRLSRRLDNEPLGSHLNAEPIDLIALMMATALLGRRSAGGPQGVPFAHGEASMKWRQARTLSRILVQKKYNPGLPLNPEEFNQEWP